jgi:hypothetical protein
MSVSLRAGPADGAVQLNGADLVTITATSVTIQQPLTLPGQLTSTLATGTAPFVVTSTTPVTNLSIGGNAATSTNANNIAITAVTTAASFYPTFVSATSGNLPQDVSTGLTFNPNTNTLTTTTFVGALTGTATNATNLTGSGTVSATATGGAALTPTNATNATNQSGGTVNAVGGISRNGVKFIQDTSPSLGTGWGTGATITQINGTLSFLITVGTAPVNTRTINMPASANGWTCILIASTGFLTYQTASTTTLITTYSTSGAGVVEKCICIGY